MNWNISGDRPIWQQLTEQLTARILKGEYPPGSRLPSVRELAAQAGVNPNTMQRAFSALEQEGLADSNRTAGRSVTEDTAVIQKARQRAVKAAAAAYIQALGELGYGPAEAAVFLKEGDEHE